ncbi:TPA: hypothetical protein ON523_003650 [Morganella morganii]|nr:hypothetical protein [Morganella morganii]
MKTYFVVTGLVTASLFLSACTSAPVKKNPVSVKNPPAQQVRSATPNMDGNKAAQAYAENKQLASQGIVIASTRNACVDGFNFLKGLNEGLFADYSGNYNRINQNYTFLNVNKEIMDKDSKELLSMTLNKKLDTLCTKVQFAGFMGVKEKIKALNDI